ncbi:porin family protein [Reichenbachiella ulvae]|uniref:Porin family protein n=1 Tax=Reichenbachiella ulvae TaxID=2980104 RepID=A0ABT3CP32_9BACT|nr:porin family protein [Reichenbachiella ulvae]MCV9385215.1 porin family protein [Reichenbachiella ulvae]
MNHKAILLTSLFLLLMVFSASAQRYGQVSKFRMSLSALAGSKTGYGKDFVDPGFGLGANLGMEYVFHKSASVAGSYSYFFTGSDVVKSVSVINVDGRYYFAGERSDSKIYALLGVAVGWSNRTGTDNNSETGLNLGIGFNHALNKDWGFNLQAKYQTPVESQFVIGAGIIRSF